MDRPEQKPKDIRQERDRSVYQFLLESLTDLDDGKTGNPNEYSIAKQWDQNRVFVRRVLRSVLHERYYPNEKLETVPTLILGKLVEILLAIESYQNKQPDRTDGTQTLKVLTYTDELQVIRKFTQLTPEEQQKLKLRAGSERQLLEQLDDIVADPVKGLDPKHCIAFFREALKIYESLKKIELKRDSPKSQVEFIRFNVEKLLEDYYKNAREDVRKKKLEEYIEKIQREIDRIEFQSGIKQVSNVLGEKVSDRLAPLFIYKLTCSLVENKVLTEQFSVFLDLLKLKKNPHYHLILIKMKIH
jgi:hypothetical protein